MNLFLIALVLVALCHTILAAYFTRDFFKKRQAPAGNPGADLPPVSIVKPVATVEEGYLENFISFCRQDYPLYEIVFAVPSQNGAVIPILESLRERFPDVEIRWVEIRQNEGPNYKVGNLMVAVQETKYELIVFSDSDMRVRPQYLRRVTSEFFKHNAGLVTCLYRNVHVSSFFSALQALTVQTDFIPNVMFDHRLKGVSYGFGATLCTSKEILSEIGGMNFLIDYLADDFQMGYQIHKKGYRIRIAPFLVDQVANGKNFKTYFLQGLRAAITHKACRPIEYRLGLITQAVFFAFVHLATEAFSAEGMIVFTAVCGIRMLAFVYLDAAVMRNVKLRRYAWLIPLNDLLNAFIWILSLFLRTVYWKDRKFQVLKEGRMVEVQAYRGARYVAKTKCR